VFGVPRPFSKLRLRQADFRKVKIHRSPSPARWPAFLRGIIGRNSGSRRALSPVGIAATLARKDERRPFDVIAGAIQKDYVQDPLSRFPLEIRPRFRREVTTAVLILTSLDGGGSLIALPICSLICGIDSDRREMLLPVRTHESLCAIAQAAPFTVLRKTRRITKWQESCQTARDCPAAPVQVWA